MERADLRVLRGVATDLGAAAHHREDALVDERSQRLFEDRPERLVDRVHLEEDDLVLDEELVEYIHRRDRRHVPAAEHETHAALGLPSRSR